MDNPEQQNNIEVPKPVVDKYIDLLIGLIDDLPIYKRNGNIPEAIRLTCLILNYECVKRYVSEAMKREGFPEDSLRTSQGYIDNANSSMEEELRKVYSDEKGESKDSFDGLRGKFFSKERQAQIEEALKIEMRDYKPIQLIVFDKFRGN